MAVINGYFALLVRLREDKNPVQHIAFALVFVTGVFVSNSYRAFMVTGNKTKGLLVFSHAMLTFVSYFVAVMVL
jgi:hypothetical protein